MAEYKRNIVATLQKRMGEPRRLVQMLIGPRQTGKSTVIRQAVTGIDLRVRLTGHSSLLFQAGLAEALI